MAEPNSLARRMNDTTRAEILRLWGEGYTGGQIAIMLGVTRNSVIGVSYRARKNGIITKKMKAKKEEKPVKIKVKKEKIVKQKIKPIIEKVEYLNDDLDNCTIYTLKYNSCRFIVEEGDHETTKYCGKEIIRESYCPYHYRLCYVPSKYSSESIGK